MLKIKNLTVGLLTNDKSSTIQKTMESLKSQIYRPEKLIVIKNICPVSKAVSDLLTKVTTEFVIVLDDDIVFLCNDSLKQMVLEIEKNKMDETLFMLEDPVFGKIKGIRIYRTSEILKILKNLKIITDWDSDINKELQKNNKTITLNTIIAKHHIEWNELDIYWKMFNVGQKIKNRPTGYKKSNFKRCISSLCKIINNENLDLFLSLYGFCGLIDGVRNERKDSFLSYENKFNNEKFEQFKKLIEKS